jgi:glyoxylase-like metal-dependent hydrolase (beta-lactamase superfamily II)
MIHEIFPVGPLQCNCSVIGDESTHEAIVVDPGDNIDRVLLALHKHQLKLKQIVITHGHIDHVGGAMKLKQATGAPICLNSNDQMQLQFLDQMAAWIGIESPGPVTIDAHLPHDSTIFVGNIQAKAIHTPGHTEGSSCIYFPSEKKLIAGDTLFAGSIGRTDLPGGDSGKIIRSLHERVLTLPEDTIVIPGHGPATTIGEEKQSNPFVV